MRRVILESPYRAATPEGTPRNLRYARACVKDCLQRGDAPIASHLLFTQPGILDDGLPAERDKGMRAGWAWIAVANAMVVYTDLGISDGMSAGIARAESHNVPVIYRKIYRKLEDWDG